MVVKSECLDIVEYLSMSLVSLGAAYDRELVGDRPRAKFWLNNAKSKLDHFYKLAPQYEKTINDIKEGIDKLGETKPEDYYFAHDAVEFMIVDRMARDFTACQCPKD